MSYVLFFSLLFSIYYRIIFGTGKSGISVVLYVIPFLVCIIYLIKNNNKIKNKEAFIWCIPIALLSFTYLIFNNEFFLRWNVLFIPIFILVFIIKIQNKNITFNNLIREIFEAVFVPINHLGEVFQDVKKFYIGEKKLKEKEDKKQNNENLFKGIVITFIMACIVLILLSSADSSFGSFISHILVNILHFGNNINIYRILWEIFLTFLMYLYLSSFLKLNIINYEEEDVKPKTKKDNDDTLTIRMVLTVLNIIYLLFIIIQIKTVATYNSGDLASYARQGFFQLMIVSLINFVTILIASAKENFEDKKDYLVISSIIMVIFTEILVILAGVRMYQYELQYGYTLKRTLVYFILITEFILLIPTLLKIIGKDIKLEKVYFSVIVTVYLIMNFSNLNWIVAQRNLNRFYETGKIDVYYLTSLGTDATSQMIKLLEDENISNENKQYLAISLSNLYEKNENINFRNFNYSKYFSKVKIEKFKKEHENLFSSNINFEESSADSEIKNKSSYYDGTYYGKIGSVKYKVFNTEFLNNSEFNYYGRMLYQNHIYYMQIENYKTYCEYKKIFQDILEMSEDDFENQFMVIGFPEDINNLGIKVDNIFNSNGTLYINFTKFSDYEQNTYIINENGFSFVIPRSMERESFGIGVDMYNGYNNKSTNSLVAFNESHENENYTKEECIQIALDYAQTVANECVSSLAKDYYSKFTKVYEVNEFVSQRSNNYWDLIIANTPITDSNLNLGADESTYEIILVSPDDDLEVNRAYFYVNPYTGKVIAGREMSD